MENYLKISLIKKLNRKYLSDEVYHLPKEILLFQNSILKNNIIYSGSSHKLNS